MTVKSFLEKFIPRFVLNFYHFSLSLIGAFFYTFPSRRIKVIGVTGTSGKTTVVYLITSILEEAGYKVASLSSINFKIADKVWENKLKMTMPGRLKIQRFLRQSVKSGCQYAVIEVTSEGILQYRHSFIDFDVAIITNLTPEHIERHGGFINYRKAKLKLFKATKDIHILNLDDENVNYFLKIPSRRKILYTFKGKAAGIPSQASFFFSGKRNLEILKGKLKKYSALGLEFQLGDTTFHLKLPGKFNAYNALGAISVALSQNISLRTCQAALERITSLPGRMEVVAAKPFRVVVDYAHTPASLEYVYKTLKGSLGFGNDRRMICVLGACGGGRDKWKRPKLGEIAGRYCDEIIITNEDPYDESPLEIMKEVASGILKHFPGRKYEMILGREKAIKTAINSAKARDIIIITGKGSEPWMCLANGKKIPWDDRRIVREEFFRRRENSNFN